MCPLHAQLKRVQLTLIPKGTTILSEQHGLQIDYSQGIPVR